MLRSWRTRIGAVAVLLTLALGSLGTNVGCKPDIKYGRWTIEWQGAYDVKMVCKGTGRECIVGMEFGFAR